MKEAKAFFKNSFATQMEYLCFRWYKDLPWGDMGANSFTESQNASLKKSCAGPKANHGMDNSQQRIFRHNKKTMERLQRDSTNRLTEALTIGLEIVSEEEVVLQSLSLYIDHDILKVCEAQWKQDEDYLYYQNSPVEYFVRRKIEPVKKDDTIHPFYVRTRVIYVKVEGRKARLVCNCGLQKRQGE